MKFVLITRSDGSQSVFEDNYTGDSFFIWKEGNYSCDCNRHLFFERGLGREPDDAACGEGEYSVEIFDGDGNSLYAD